MLNSSLQRPMKRHQKVCNTCGAVGRELQAIPVSSHYLYACSFLSLSKDDVLCFECRAMLRKFLRFRLRAKRVKALLECASYNPKIQCLSTLTQTVISPNDAIYIAGDLDCVRVKDEIPDLQSDLAGVVDELEKPWSNGNFEQVPRPLPQAYSIDEYKWHESIITTVEGTRNVQDPIADVKREEAEVEPDVGPMLVPKLGVPKISKKHPMSGNDNDNDGSDSETDTASEVGDEPQVEISKKHPMSDNDIDNDGSDSETDTASEVGDVPQVKIMDLAFLETNPGALKDRDSWECERDRVFKPSQAYTLTHIDHAEVLSQMERARGEERYRLARFKCDQCAVIIQSQPHHRAHAQLHCEKKGRVVCPICLQRFQTRAEAQTHIAMHYCRFDCSYCKHVEYGNQQKMEYHFQTRHNTEPRFCRRCNARFTSVLKLNNHMRSTHARAYAWSGNFGTRYQTATLPDHHLRVAHTKVPRLECGVCHKMYKGEQNLRMHVWTVHERPQQNNENAYCVECNKQFPNIETYRIHLKKAKIHSANRYECDYCGKTYTVKGSLMSHIVQTHTLLKLLKCHHCSRRFLNTRALECHRRRRHGITPPRTTFPCRRCEKTFTSRRTLNDHMNTHLGIRPYECKICHMNFAHSGNLRNHNRSVHLKKQDEDVRKTKKKKYVASGGVSMDADGEGP